VQFVTVPFVRAQAIRNTGAQAGGEKRREKSHGSGYEKVTRAFKSGIFDRLDHKMAKVGRAPLGVTI
jgi:hypothetical protein